jgi:hypothetical protein
MPANLTSQSACIVNGRVYVLLHNMTWTCATHYDTSAFIYEYDITDDVWRLKTALPGSYYGTGAGVCDGKIYFAGVSLNSSWAMSSCYDVYEYDPVSNSGRFRSRMKKARFRPAVASVGGKIYAVGGRFSPPLAEIASVEMYEPALDSWSYKAPLPVERAFAAAVTIDGKIYVVGGCSNTSLQTTTAVYDPQADIWSSDTGLLTPRIHIAAAVVNGNIYAIGGDDDGSGNSPYIEMLEMGTVANTTESLSLDVSLSTIHSPARVGDWIAVTLTVTNSGTTPAFDLNADMTPGAGALLTSWLTGPWPAGVPSLAPGAGRTFTWTYSASGVGTVVFTATLFGSNYSTFKQYRSSSALNILPRPADLAATLSVNPQSPGVDDVITIALMVQNTGGAVIDSLNPSLVFASGSSLVRYQSGPSPSDAVTLPSRQTVIYRWTYTARSPGSLQIVGAVTGVNTDDGTAVESHANSTVSLRSLGVKVYPNPFDPSSSVRGTVKFKGVRNGAKVLVFTASGLKVWEGSPVEDRMVEWNGRNETNKPVAPGIYIWIAKGAGLNERGELVVTR